MTIAAVLCSHVRRPQSVSQSACHRCGAWCYADADYPLGTRRMCHLCAIEDTLNDPKKPVDAVDLEAYTARAADGDLYAQFRLGLIFRRHDFADNARGLALLRSAATQGLARAQAELGRVLLESEAHKDNPQLHDEAVNWLRAAARQELGYAEVRLARLLLAGGASGSEGEGEALLRRAAERGYPIAQYDLAGLVETREEQIEWLQKAARLSLFPEAAFDLACLFDGDDDGARDEILAARWYHEAARLGHAESQYRIAVRYAEGTGVTPDGNQAARWAQLAAAQGHPDACWWIGVSLLKSADEKAHGVGVGWLSTAAAKGHAGAQYDLARVVLEGTLVDRDVEFAQLLCWQAAEQGHPDALRMLGEMEPDALVC